MSEPGVTESRVQDEVEPDTLGEAVELLRAAFPDMRCLRCGHDDFRLLDAPVYTGRLSTREHRIGLIHFHPFPRAVVLVCQSCGMTEQHDLDILEKAEKPIRATKNE